MIGRGRRIFCRAENSPFALGSGKIIAMFLRQKTAIFFLGASLMMPAAFSFAQSASTTGTTTDTASSVSLFIEPETYIPPFYKGAPLFSPESSVKLVAMPNIKVSGIQASSKDLIFTWSENGTVLGDNSGQGKDSLVIDGGFPVKNLDIAVDVSDPNGDILASDEQTLVVNNPQILFYELSSLYGVVFNKALNNGFNMGTEEDLTVVAKPFYWGAANDVSPDLSYAWIVNGNPVTLAGKKNQLLLHQTNTGTSGITAISLNISSLAHLFENASANLNISFGKQ
jgi:hypothetical protein